LKERRLQYVISDNMKLHIFKETLRDGVKHGPRPSPMPPEMQHINLDGGHQWKQQTGDIRDGHAEGRRHLIRH
jgi:hypothetical protein